MSSKGGILVLVILMFFLGLLSAIKPLQSGISLLLLIFLLLCFVRPFYGFLFIAFSSFFNNINFIFDSPIRMVDERYTVFSVPLLLLLFVVLTEKISAGSGNEFHCGKGMKVISNRATNSDILILLFVVWAAMTMIWTIDYYHGINSLYNLFLGYGLYCLARYFLSSSTKLSSFFRAFYVGGVFLLILFFVSNQIEGLSYSTNIYDKISFSSDLVIYGKRPGGFAPPHFAANVFVFLFFIGCALFKSASKVGRIGIIIINLILCIAIFASGSKAASGSFLVSVIFFNLIYPPLRKKSVVTIPLSVGILVFLFIFNSLVLGNDRMSTGGEVNSMSLTFRLEFWQAGFDMMQNYVLGAGVGGFARLVDPWPGAHSVYFATLFDLGIVGGAIILVFLFTYLFRLQNIVPDQAGGDNMIKIYCLLAFWLAFLIHALVDFGYYVQHLWLFLGVSTALLNIVESEIQKKQLRANPLTRDYTLLNQKSFGRRLNWLQ